jgi:hypothetical protein
MVAPIPRFNVKSVLPGSALIAPTHDQELLIVPPEPKFRPSEWAWMMDPDPQASWVGIRYNSGPEAPTNTLYLDCRESGHEAEIKSVLAVARTVGMQCYVPPGFAQRQPKVSAYLRALAAGADSATNP